ncbi:MAG TPA: D-aminoacylase [bacterium]|nr:D-aminoacylase [bacterium]
MADYIIRNGLVVDGSGAPAFKADVAIKGDRIEAIGEINGNPGGAVEIDASGKIVCPGIVDCHSHADMSIYAENHDEILAPLVRQGITTFVGGNCGMALSPVGATFRQQIKDYIEAFTGKDFDSIVKWTDFGSFVEMLESKKGLLLNTALLAPHGVIRINSMGFAARQATDEEVRTMCADLEQCMEQGAVGLSTGLQYMPGSQSDTRELVELGKVLSKYDGIFTSHLRSYMNTLPQAVDEVIEVAEKNDIRAQISHIFWVPDMGFIGRPMRFLLRGLIKMSKYWTLPIPLDTEVRKQLAKLDKLRDKGINVGMDVMPTTTGFTHMFAFFPPWTLEGTMEQILQRLADKNVRKEILKDILTGKLIWPHTGRNTWSLNLFKIMGWECVRIMSVISEKNKYLEGMNLPVIAKQQGKHPFDTVCDLMLEENGKVLVFESMGEPEDNFTERSMYAALKHPEVSISTDTILLGFGKPSYLFHGCYPKFISRYVRDRKMIGLETAVRKMTGLPAGHFNLKDRGMLKEGWFADVLVLDLESIRPNCDFVNPQGDPSGVDHVFINGYHAVRDGKLHTEKLAGRVLKR